MLKPLTKNNPTCMNTDIWRESRVPLQIVLTAYDINHGMYFLNAYCHEGLAINNQTWLIANLNLRTTSSLHVNEIGIFMAPSSSDLVHHDSLEELPTNLRKTSLGYTPTSHNALIIFMAANHNKPIAPCYHSLKHERCDGDDELYE